MIEEVSSLISFTGTGFRDCLNVLSFVLYCVGTGSRFQFRTVKRGKCR